MLKTLRRFLKSERGAVTVDWVVLCAGIAMIGLVAVTSVGGGLKAPADSTGDYMTDYQPWEGKTLP